MLFYFSINLISHSPSKKIPADMTRHYINYRLIVSDYAFAIFLLYHITYRGLRDDLMLIPPIPISEYVRVCINSICVMSLMSYPSLTYVFMFYPFVLWNLFFRSEVAEKKRRQKDTESLYSIRSCQKRKRRSDSTHDIFVYSTD